MPGQPICDSIQVYDGIAHVGDTVYPCQRRHFGGSSYLRRVPRHKYGCRVLAVVQSKDGKIYVRCQSDDPKCGDCFYFPGLLRVNKHRGRRKGKR